MNIDFRLDGNTIVQIYLSQLNLMICTKILIDIFRLFIYIDIFVN